MDFYRWLREQAAAHETRQKEAAMRDLHYDSNWMRDFTRQMSGWEWSQHYAFQHQQQPSDEEERAVKVLHELMAQVEEQDEEFPAYDPILEYDDELPDDVPCQHEHVEPTAWVDGDGAPAYQCKNCGELLCEDEDDDDDGGNILVPA